VVQSLVGVINAELLEAVVLERLETEHVQQPNEAAPDKRAGRG